MVKKADIGGKRLISLSPTAWVQWVTQQPDVIAQEILSSEFQWVSRENDVLVKTYSPTQGEFLVLNELQLRYSDRLRCACEPMQHWQKKNMACRPIPSW